MNFDSAALVANENFRIELPHGVWLMDNHKWALSAWAHTHTGGRRWLLHADHHWDGVDMVSGNADEQAALLEADLATLDQRIADEDGIQYDAFIAPAVIRGYFDQVHFYCTQDDDWDRGLQADLCNQFGVKQRLHESLDTFASLPVDTAFVFDLCLDLFNDANGKMFDSNLWPDERIQAFLDATRHLIEAASVVTVSLSFGYSGTEEDTRRLAQLVVPQLVAWRSTAT